MVNARPANHPVRRTRKYCFTNLKNILIISVEGPTFVLFFQYYLHDFFIIMITKKKENILILKNVPTLTIGDFEALSPITLITFLLNRYNKCNVVRGVIPIPPLSLI